jgi:aspartate/methionine/tyrosine aminotransferase
LITSDKELQTIFLAAKEQISICGSVIHEWIGEQILGNRDVILGKTLTEMRRRRQLVSDWIENEDLLEWVRPSGGVVCFPRMKTPPPGGTQAFYQRLLSREGAYLGPGHWFEMPDDQFRLGYGWPTAEELQGGLQAISRALRS